MGNLKEIKTESEQDVCAVCHVQASQHCSICKAVAYCSKEHQKQHWKQHKSVCKSDKYEIKSNDELGRYVIASHDLKCNDKILVEQPLVMGPKLFEPSPVCLGCYRPPTPGIRCPRCLWPACHPHCSGLTDPHHHSIECFILSLGKSTALQPGVLRYEIITPLRCLLLQKRNQKKWQQLMTLVAHSDLRSPETETYKELDETVVNYLIDNYLSKLDEGLTYSKELLHRICGIVDTNATEVRGASDILLHAVFATYSLLEHNCLPNTKFFFDPDNKITLLSNCNIKKGQHLSTSYTHVLWGTMDRREHLSQNKYIECRCERCSDPTEIGTYISALRCHGLEQSNTCGGWQLPVSPLDDDSGWKCNKCPVTLKSMEAKNLVSMLATETENVIRQAKPSVEEVKELIKKLEFFLHPHHYLCYEAKHLLIQLYGHQYGYSHQELPSEQLEKKKGICEELLSVNKILDPGFSRLVLYSAVIMYELQSVIIELIDRKLLPEMAKEEARSLLIETVEVLKHEPINSPGSEMKVLVKKALNELEVKFKNVA